MGQTNRVLPFSSSLSSLNFLPGYFPKRPTNFHQGLDSKSTLRLRLRVSHKVGIELDHPRLKKSNNGAASVREIPKLLPTLNLRTRLREVRLTYQRSKSHKLADTVHLMLPTSNAPTAMKAIFLLVASWFRTRTDRLLADSTSRFFSLIACGLTVEGKFPIYLV